VTPRRLIEPARLAGTSLLRTQSDARLVDLVRAGHDSAFEAIVQRYRKPLLGYCSRLLPASRAEDAVQQTFLKAYQAMVSGDAELKLRPWLYKIAHNASLNLLRQNGWSHEQLDENMDGVQRPDQALELRERLRKTVAAVNALPERQRDAVLLREIDGLSYDEIAATLGVGDGAVRQLLHRARATLRAGMTAVTPIGLTERLAAALAGTGGDPSARVAEMATGLGLGAGAVKVGAAVLATGAIATGVVAVPIVKHHRHHSAVPQAEAAVPAPVEVSSSSSPGRTVQVDDRSGASHRSTPLREHHHGGDSNSGKSPSRGPNGSSGHTFGSPVQQHQERSGSGNGGGGDHHSGSGRSGDGSGTSGDGRSGGGSDDTTTNPTDDGGGDDHSGSGSDDTVTVPTSPTTVTGPVTTDSGKDGGSGSDGGSDSGSGSGSSSGPDSPDGGGD
jgi:RNA polymerase sigma factor (sigma-70 family)